MFLCPFTGGRAVVLGKAALRAMAHEPELSDEDAQLIPTGDFTISLGASLPCSPGVEFVKESPLPPRPAPSEHLKAAAICDLKSARTAVWLKHQQCRASGRLCLWRQKRAAATQAG